LDRLLLLLDTGSSTSIRHTAAKQLAQLAAKTVATDAATEEDVKWNRHVSRGDPLAWAELMAVVARVSALLRPSTSDHVLSRLFHTYIPSRSKLEPLRP
jgi:TATA-binding protein-associated factor